MARSKRRTSGSDRDAGGFIALPFSVIDSPAYRGLSVHARALLIDISRQLRGDNNGSLLCSRAHMAPLGWRSNDMLTKSRDELLAAGLLFQTVQGHRPNRASWYAVTWLGLDKLDGFDAEAAAFRRSAYRVMLTTSKPTREQIYAKWDSAEKTQSLARPAGQKSTQ